MTELAQDPALPREETLTIENEHHEARRVLRDLAHKKAGAIPAEFLADHVLALHADADWPVKLGAMEALLRRFGFARRDDLRVAERPADRAAFGRYAVRRKRGAFRPYETVLAGLDPLRASCDCPDFSRASLGLCKHLLVVLDDLATRPRKWAAARDCRDAALDRAHIYWEPIRPLHGSGDWLAGVRFTPGIEAGRGRATARETELRRLARGSFARVSGSGNFELKTTHRDSPRKRAALVERLRASLARNRRPGLGQPALRELLREESARLERCLADVKNKPTVRRRIDRLKRKLYDYQLDGVDKFLDTGRLLLADDMGLGKTTQAVACCAALFEAGRIDRGLLIVPASLKPQWRQEWYDVCDAPLEVVDGVAEQRAAMYRRGGRGFLVVNYEQVIRDLPLMAGFDPQLVVLDEAQRIKNWATKTAACVKQLQVPYRLVLTGTPMENRLSDLASIMDWVDDRALEPKWRLLPFHTLYRQDDGDAPEAKNKAEAIGMRHLDVLRDRLDHCLIRRQRPEVLSQLPSRTDTVIPVPLSEAQAEEHDALTPAIARLMQSSKRRPLTQPEFLKLMQLLATQRIIANGLAQLNFPDVFPALQQIDKPDRSLLESLSSPKLLEVRDVIQKVVVDQERKVVVFSQWHRMLRLSRWAIDDVLRDAGLEVRFFTGQESAKQRTKNLVEFHDDPNVRVLFCTDAGGVGLNLQRAASCCINLELPWNPAVLEQRVGRIYRLGQENPIDVYNLVSENCIETRIAGVVRDKSAVFKGLFDGTSDTVEFDRATGFLAGIQRLVEAPVVPEVPELAEASGPSAWEHEAEDEVEELLAAADESRDGLTAATAPRDAATATAGARPLATSAPTATEVHDLFAEVEVTPIDGGGLRIEASPQAATTLAALFTGMAGLLRQAEGQGS